LVAVALALAACAGHKKSATTPTGNASGSAVAVEPNGTSSVTTVTTEGGNTVTSLGHIIYFDFDKSDIRPEYNQMVMDHARKLARNASVKVRLEGHTDERGSREYNIGLGERRAQAVRRALQLQGVADAQISTVSYGEERPAVPGSNEEAWAKNRRVEIVNLN
jgi:peptidoglycan-associated lipoprotein